MTKGKIILTDTRNINKPQAIEYAEITYDIDEYGSKAVVFCKDEAGILQAIYNLTNPTVQCVLWNKE